MKWIDRLRRSVKAEGFRTTDVDLAVYWSTCAVGERAAALGYDTKALRDKDVPAKLQRLGKAFDLAVENDDVPSAFSLYTQIQEWS